MCSWRFSLQLVAARSQAPAWERTSWKLCFRPQNVHLQSVMTARRSCSEFVSWWILGIGVGKRSFREKGVPKPELGNQINLGFQPNISVTASFLSAR